MKAVHREAVEKLLTAAGGRLIAMYDTIAEGPGAMAIFDINPAAAPAVVGVRQLALSATPRCGVQISGLRRTAERPQSAHFS